MNWDDLTIDEKLNYLRSRLDELDGKISAILLILRGN